MERRMKSKEARWGETVSQTWNDNVSRTLARSDQFDTRDCARCAGLLVNEWSHDLSNAGEYNANVLRCVQCGHRVDSVILKNQIRSLVKRARPERRQYGYLVSTSMPGDDA